MPDNRILPIAPKIDLIDEKKRALWEAMKKENEKPGLVADITRKGLRALTGSVEGLLGIEPKNVKDPEFSWLESGANLVMQSGLPFSAYGIKKLFHGTPKAFDYFDPNVYNKNDILGWMTHAAERPEYASSYANKKSYDIPGNVRPIVPEAKNVLDLFDPQIDDISQALGYADPYDRRELVRTFKEKNKSLRQGYLKGSDVLGSTHHPDANQLKREDILRKMLGERLRLSEEATENMPFDAIRYPDIGEKAWAFPRKTLLKTPWGTPLNIPEDPREIKIPADWKLVSEPVLEHEKRNLPELAYKVRMDNNRREAESLAKNYESNLPKNWKPIEEKTFDYEEYLNEAIKAYDVEQHNLEDIKDIISNEFSSVPEHLKSKMLSDLNAYVGPNKTPKTWTPLSEKPSSIDNEKFDQVSITNSIIKMIDNGYTQNGILGKFYNMFNNGAISPKEYDWGNEFVKSYFSNKK